MRNCEDFAMGDNWTYFICRVETKGGVVVNSEFPRLPECGLVEARRDKQCSKFCDTEPKIYMPNAFTVDTDHASTVKLVFHNGSIVACFDDEGREARQWSFGNGFAMTKGFTSYMKTDPLPFDVSVAFVQMPCLGGAAALFPVIIVRQELFNPGTFSGLFHKWSDVYMNYVGFFSNLTGVDKKNLAIDVVNTAYKRYND